MKLIIPEGLVLGYLPKLIRAYKQDRKNRYALLESWILPFLDEPLPDYESSRFIIFHKTIIVEAYDDNTCDGCTLSPDKIGNLKTAIGSLFHDPWYLELDDIAECWGWKVSAVRKKGDQIFGSILLALARSEKNWWKRKYYILVARTYYTGVRAFGGIVHKFGKVFALLLLCCVFSGCSGCAIPEAFEENDALYRKPVYEQTAGEE